MLGQPPLTLQKAGDVLGVTRQRIQQLERDIEIACLENQHAFRPIAQEAFDIVMHGGGILSVSELLQSLFANGSDGNQMRYAEPFVEFISTLPCWSDAGLQPVHDGIIACLGTTEILDQIASSIIQVAGGNADERLDLDLWSIDVDLLKMNLLLLFEQTSYQHYIKQLSDALLDTAISRTNNQLARRDNRVYSRNLYKLRFGSLTVLVETILQRSTMPMDSTEILRNAIEFRNADLDKRRIEQARSRSGKIMLWARGMYIHRDNIRIPCDLLHDIEDSIEKELNQHIPFLSISRVFSTFRAECLPGNIASATALYMYVRELGNPRLDYPNYPYVLLKGNERLPVPVVLEQYMIDAGKSVSRRELSNYATNTLGINADLFRRYASQVPNVLLLDRGVLLHIDQLTLDPESINELISSVIDVLLQEKQISAEKLFSDMRITCLTLGITTPYLLHSLLLLKAAGKISGQYPQLTLGSDAEVMDSANK